MAEVTNHTKPFIVDKNLGAALDIENAQLTETTSDGTPVVPPTQEQKYLFDMRGWLLVPGVLSGDELAEMQEFAYKLHHEPESIPKHERSPLGGPLQRLSDHPNVVGFLNEFLAHPALSSQDCYGFRMESCHLFYRTVGDAKFNPHNGNGMLRFPGDSHLYRCIPGKGHSGLTRVVWELNPVKYRQGGTLFITASHKAVYTAPDTIRSQDSPIWDTYECPAGSLLFFTEALTHSAHTWTNEENYRLATFSCYNTVNSKWSAWEPHPKLLEEMPAKRQTLFRPVRAANNLIGDNYRH
ncbi:hypothetical protein F4009_20210 [Candidatus Poribacteria bacterium]|nr:hypothetical protein [Candidatus Poribacteria bacterium]MYK96289.1 hypothetical protein [Candidatus Poribacteria bacterium]